MFSVCRNTHPATGVEHAVSCCFFNSDEKCLVTAGANIIKVFRLIPDMDIKEKLTEGTPPKMKLECLATYTLWGSIMCLQTVKVQGTGRDLLLVSFKDAKLAVLQYDPATHNLATLSLHYFEEDDMKGGWTNHHHIPWIRVDPENRCFVMLLYGRKLAVLPLRREANAEDGDPLDIKPLDSKAPQAVSAKAPVMASYVIVLKDLDEKLDNIIDLQFLHGYYEPTLLLLYEPVKTFPGRTAVRMDTCAMLGISLNLQARVHPSIWSVSGLPFDCVCAVPIQRPLGGCLILAVNSVIYLNQSIPPYGVSLNSVTNHSTNFPLKVQPDVCLSLEGVCITSLGPQKLALSLRSGQLYLLTLLADSVRSIRSFHFDKAASSVLTTCMCICEDSFLFLGSRLGNSLLLRFTEKEKHTLTQVERPTATTIDLTADGEYLRSYQQDGLDGSSSSKKKRLESLSDCMASDVQDIIDKDELEVYGSDKRTSTELTTYMFEVCDSLLNIGPIGVVSMGEQALQQEQLTFGGIELVTTSGYGKNGALCVLRRSVRPQLVTTFELPGCIDMWTVIGELPGQAEKADNITEADGSHSYMLLSQEDSTMVLQTGQEINEVENSGFSTSAPTIYAGNLGNNKYIVQVTTANIKLIKGSLSIQTIPVEGGALEASSADPYVCVRTGASKSPIIVLALREQNRGNARLAVLRHNPPATPMPARCCAYRDLSGLFSSAPVFTDDFFIKGENPVKKGMKQKNPKIEGANDPNVIHEIDDDELLYSGEQTPASMVTLMQTERDMREGITTHSKKDWWKKHYIDQKPTYWIFIVRENNNMEIYSLPEMRLCFLVRDVLCGAKVLTDSLESVELPSGPDTKPDIAGTPDISMEECSVTTLKEMLVVGLGNKGSRPILIIRTEAEVMIYQVFQYAKGNLKMRFRRLPLGIFQTHMEDKSDSEDPSDSILKSNVKKMRYFSNIAGYNGVFLCGAPAYWLLLTPRGELRCHPHSTAAEGSGAYVATFAPFNNVNCPQGFLYFNVESELRICLLPTHLSYDAPWPVRKVPLRTTPHFVTYHLESKTYCLVTSQSAPTQSYYKFNGEDKELSDETAKGERFPYPLQDKFSVMLVSPVSWEIIPNTKVELDDWEHVTCLKNVSLSYEGTTSGLKGYIALGTNYNYGEDITSRGRILIYDIIEVVPEPGQPLTKNRFKEIYAKEQKGPVTAITQCLGYLVSAVGQKIYIWQLRDSDLVGVAFIDTQIYVHRMLSVKSMILVADVYRSVALMRFQEHHRTLSLAARDMRNAQVMDMEFLVDHNNLGFLVSELEGNFVLFMYQPRARESFGGTKLIRKADYHLGQKINCMFRIGCRSLEDSSVLQKKHCTMFGTLDGGLGYVLPIPEKVYRRLLMLQNVMNNYCCHIAGLNPKAHRTYKSGRKLPGGPVRSMLDGDLINQFLYLPQNERHEVSKKIGTRVEEILADLIEIDKLTAHF